MFALVAGWFTRDAYACKGPGFSRLAAVGGGTQDLLDGRRAASPMSFAIRRRRQARRGATPVTNTVAESKGLLTNTHPHRFDERIPLLGKSVTRSTAGFATSTRRSAIRPEHQPAQPRPTTGTHTTPAPPLADTTTKASPDRSPKPTPTATNIERNPSPGGPRLALAAGSGSTDPQGLLRPDVKLNTISETISHKR